MLWVDLYIWNCSSSIKQGSVFLPPLNICGFKNSILIGSLEKIGFFLLALSAFCVLYFYLQDDLCHLMSTLI